MRSTFTYVSYASPSADSGIQARRIVEAGGVFDTVSAGAFCCKRAMKPGMLSR